LATCAVTFWVAADSSSAAAEFSWLTAAIDSIERETVSALLTMEAPASPEKAFAAHPAVEALPRFQSGTRPETAL
jgi:hypothetical protein